VTAILSQMPHLRCVTKPLYAAHPLFGRLLRASGFLASSAGKSVLEQAREALEQQFDVLVFPEGTRSPIGDIYPFHRGAFEIAKRADVSIVPLFVTCDPPTLRKGQSMFALPAVLAKHAVTILPPLDSSDYATAAELRAAVELRYRDALAMLPPP
jgi:1-acyl-sn-glycerol-3-phosphate acyltransferase